MTSPCSSCRRCDGTKYRSCKRWTDWFRRTWGSIDPETAIDQIAAANKYRNNLWDVYREATFLTADEQRERDRKKEVTVTAEHRRRSVCG